MYKVRFPLNVILAFEVNEISTFYLMNLHEPHHKQKRRNASKGFQYI